MSARTVALMIALVLSACALPGSKLDRSTANETASAKPPANDSGMDAARSPSNAPDATGDASDAGTATSDTDAGPADAGMIKHSAADAGVMTASTKAGSGGAAAPKPNGELCRGNEDCANGNCKTGENGERRCYGALKVDQTCTGPYDCDGYTCVTLTLKGKAGVCLDKTACSAQGTCFEEYGIAVCQLDQQCGAGSDSFNQCYLHACALAGTSNAQCLAALPAKQALNQSACCPTGGALNGSCNTAPQCGCGDGMKCDIDSQTAKPTCEAMGSVPAGGNCMSPAECLRGYGCMGGVCKQYCNGPNDTTCAGGGECDPVLDSKAQPTGAYYCTRTCDPFDSGSTVPPFLGCGPGQRCNPMPDGHTDCSISGTIPAGASCDDGTGHAAIISCEPGAICVNLVCAPFCHLGQNDCKVGTCRTYALQAQVGYCDPS